jgi:hypothetical protein
MPDIIVLDTNILLLLVVGSTDEKYIALHKRLDAYDVTDYKILCGIIAQSKGVVFTPNVLTETSNLGRYIKEPLRSEISAKLAHMITNGSEKIIVSKDASARPEYVRLGLADSVLLQVTMLDGILLTDDLDLYLAASYANIPVQNFNHIRDALRPEFQL